MNLKKWLNYLPEFIRHPLVRSKINLGNDQASHIIIKVAETKDELQQAFQVLHDAYVDETFMDPELSGLRMTKYHALPTTAVIIAKDTIQNRVVATLSMIRNSELGLPLDSVCSLDVLKIKYPSLTEISSLAIDKDYRKDPTLVFWPLMRAVFRYAQDVMGVEAYIMGVHPKRHDLYKGILGFNKLKNSELKKYEFVKNAPVVAYVADLKEQAAWFFEKYAKLPLSANWHQYCVRSELSPQQYQFVSRKYYGVQKSFMNAENFQYFFQSQTQNAKTLLAAEKLIVEKVLSVGKRFVIDATTNVIPLGKYRSTERFHTKLSSHVFCDSDLNQAVDATILNLSATGVGIESKSELPETVYIRASLGREVQSVLKLKVKNKRGESYGCEILSCDQPWVDFMNTLTNQSSLQNTLRVG